MLELKVCGMTNPLNLAQVALTKPDYLGFIHYPKSKRFVDKNFLLKYAKDVPGIKSILVTVNMEIEELQLLISEVQPFGVQLHGGEDVDYCNRLISMFENNKNLNSMRHGNLSYSPKLIKVFSVDEEFDFDQTKQFETVADYFLFDTKCDSYGGSGIKFNWEKLNEYKGEVPFFLSGGISSEDIDRIKAVDHKKIIGVDINSRFECIDQPLLKQPELIEQFKRELSHV